MKEKMKAYGRPLRRLAALAMIAAAAGMVITNKKKEF